MEEEKGEFLDVAILSTGCYSCNRMGNVMAAFSETGIQASLDHITDPNVESQCGILSTTALIIYGKVKTQCNLPSESMIKK